MPPAQITSVSTPLQLKQAIKRGARDIVITNHLDLTTLQVEDTSICPDGCQTPLSEIRVTRSIRVRLRDFY
jgi:hypothetical protein